ncbi:MAG: NTP transferase domain-containing protein [Armatimonadota bacterium]
MSEDKVDVVILAGAPAGVLFPEDRLRSRGMVPVAGKAMVQWVVDAFRGASSIDRIIVVGAVSVDGVDVILQPGENFVENIKRGLEALDGSELVLISTCDIPLLTSQAADDFVAKARKADVDFVYPIVPRTYVEKRYPGAKRTYVRTADGVFTGGNMVLVKPSFILQNWDAIKQAYRARKQVTKLARIIGLGILLRLIFAKIWPALLRISLLEAAAARVLKCSVAVVVSAYPEIAEDVDKPSDLVAVERFLVRRIAGDG